MGTEGAQEENREVRIVSPATADQTRRDMDKILPNKKLISAGAMSLSPRKNVDFRSLCSFLQLLLHVNAGDLKSCLLVKFLSA